MHGPSPIEAHDELLANSSLLNDAELLFEIRKLSEIRESRERRKQRLFASAHRTREQTFAPESVAVKCGRIEIRPIGGCNMPWHHEILIDGGLHSGIARLEMDVSANGVKAMVTFVA